MTEREFRRRFPNASDATVKANVGLCPAEPRQHRRPCPLDSLTPGKEKGTRRVVVRFTCYRTRLLDWDNLPGSCKTLCDGLRYAHLIVDDSPAHIDASVEQIKVTRRDQEKTEIQILYP